MRYHHIWASLLVYVGGLLFDRDTTGAILGSAIASVGFVYVHWAARQSLDKQAEALAKKHAKALALRAMDCTVDALAARERTAEISWQFEGGRVVRFEVLPYPGPDAGPPPDTGRPTDVSP